MFDAAIHEVPVPEPLVPAERAMLVELAQVGGPLWKVLRSMVDYRNNLRESLVNINADDDEDRRKLRVIQATIQAADWAVEEFNKALDDQDPNMELPSND